MAGREEVTTTVDPACLPDPCPDVPVAAVGRRTTDRVVTSTCRGDVQRATPRGRRTPVGECEHGDEDPRNIDERLNSAVRRGLIDRNPAETIELPKPVRPDLLVWTPGELSRFLEAAGEDDLYPLFVLLVLCGLRRGEAVGLRWRDVDLDQGCLHIRQQLVVVGGDVIAGAPKSKAGHRLVVLDSATVTLLECHRREQDRRRQTAGESWVENDLVFTTVTGEALDPSVVSRRFDRLVAKSGLPRIRLA